MSIESTLRLILASPGLVTVTSGGQARAEALLSIGAEIGQRVVPIMAEKPCRPFIAYTINSSDDPAPSHDGPSGFIRAEFDFVIVTDTFEKCLTVSDLVRTIFDGFVGTVNTQGGVNVRWIRFRDQSDIEQAPEPGGTKPTYVRQQTFAALVKLPA